MFIPDKHAFRLLRRRLTEGGDCDHSTATPLRQSPNHNRWTTLPTNIFTTESLAATWKCVSSISSLAQRAKKFAPPSDKQNDVNVQSTTKSKLKCYACLSADRDFFCERYTIFHCQFVFNLRFSTSQRPSLESSSVVYCSQESIYLFFLRRFLLICLSTRRIWRDENFTMIEKFQQCGWKHYFFK